MRLRACLGGVLLALGACAGLPERVRIDVDGRSIEIRQRGLSSELLAGAWAASPDCAGGGGAIPSEIREVHVVGPGELEATGPEGEPVRLYRCGQ